MADPPGFKSEYFPTGQTTFYPVNVSTNIVFRPNINKGYYWKPWSPGEPVPSTAVHGGQDIDGTNIYVGRAYHEGDLIPAKVIPEKSAAYIPYGGQEVLLPHCEVLCQQHFEWIPAFSGQVPGNAVSIGHTADGEQLYAGRVYHEGSHTIGKIHPSHGCCYIPFDGKEMSFSQYEVLVTSNY